MLFQAFRPLTFCSKLAFMPRWHWLPRALPPPHQNSGGLTQLVLSVSIVQVLGVFSFLKVRYRVSQSCNRWKCRSWMTAPPPKPPEMKPALWLWNSLNLNVTCNEPIWWKLFGYHLQPWPEMILRLFIKQQTWSWWDEMCLQSSFI